MGKSSKAPWGKGKRPFIIAELSANHEGSINKAFESIKAAKEAGADAIKIQTYTPDTMTIRSDREEFQIKDGLWNGYNLYDLYEKAHTPYSWHKPLFDYAKKVGIIIFSSPFDETAVDLLESLNTPFYKIASFEAIDLPLIKRVAQTKKPLIISTGMANLEEIGEAVEVAREHGCKSLTLLHCVSSYPAPVEEANLKVIPDLAERFGVMAGLSDHTLGLVVATTSVALGACVIEKHFKLSRDGESVDGAFSLEPKDLELLCQNVKAAWSSLGAVDYQLKKSEKTIRRRSIYAIQNIKKGERLTEDNIKRIRPGLGLMPKHWDQALNSIATCDIVSGTPISFDIISNK